MPSNDQIGKANKIGAFGNGKLDYAGSGGQKRQIFAAGEILEVRI